MEGLDPTHWPIPLQMLVLVGGALAYGMIFVFSRYVKREQPQTIDIDVLKREVVKEVVVAWTGDLEKVRTDFRAALGAMKDSIAGELGDLTSKVRRVEEDTIHDMETRLRSLNDLCVRCEERIKTLFDRGNNSRRRSGES